MTDGLASFQLKPSGLTGLSLLDHLALHARRRTKDKDDKLRPSPYLDVEMTKTQAQILDPKPADLTARALLIDAGGNGATLNLAKRKLDATGNFRSITWLANAPERMARLQAKALLASSMSEIARMDAALKKKKKVAAAADIVGHVAEAAKKFDEKKAEVGKLTIKDIRAILISVLGIDEPPNITKPAAVKALEDAIKGDVDALVKIKALRPNDTVITVCAKLGGSPVGEPDHMNSNAGHDADCDAQDADGADANAESSADDDDDVDDVSPPEPTDDGSAGTGAGDGDELSDDGSCEGSDDGAGASSGEPEEAEEVATPPPPGEPVPTHAHFTRRNKKLRSE